uniref:Ig-like domain-containing protein n=1 Tax=Anopheles farauti TaxID=69004 RepID=A0A182QJV1_9DIPT
MGTSWFVVTTPAVSARNLQYIFNGENPLHPIGTECIIIHPVQRTFPAKLATIPGRTRLPAFLGRSVRPVTNGNGHVPTHLEKVLVNETAQIKCDVSSNLTNDRILLVVWYKDNVPIYSVFWNATHPGLSKRETP